MFRPAQLTPPDKRSSLSGWMLDRWLNPNRIESACLGLEAAKKAAIVGEWRGSASVRATPQRALFFQPGRGGVCLLGWRRRGWWRRIRSRIRRGGGDGRSYL